MDSEPRGSRPVLPKDIRDYSRDELLWDWRTSLEGGHRHITHLHAVQIAYRPSVQDINCLPEMDTHEFFDTCNKSVPVYLLTIPQRRLLATVLHNYIYRRWFRPYRSEIEHQRFICKTITPKDLPDEPTPSPSTIETLAAMNGAICAEAEARRRSYVQHLASGVADLHAHVIKDHRLHILQPLFRALIIIVCSQSYKNEDSKTIGRLPVLLVRKGVEDGLSAPITFESIIDKIDEYAGEDGDAVRTTLETAIDFVMCLEARKAAVFGLQPDPVITYKSFPVTALTLESLRSGMPLIGRSSQFVDREEFPLWSGDGEHSDSYIMATHEKREFRYWACIGEGRTDTGCRIQY